MRGFGNDGEGGKSMHSEKTVVLLAMICYVIFLG